MSVEKPQSFDFLGKGLVYNADELYTYDVLFFFGCSKGPRHILRTKKIPATDYFFGYNTQSGWKECDKTYSRGKLLLKAEWVLRNVPKMIQPTTEQEETEAGSPAALRGPDPQDDCKDEEVGSGYRYEEAPPIIKLSEEEMFRDDDGRVFDIEVRGDRTVNGCYFKVIDVARELQMENLKTTIQHKEYGYEQGKHYKTFICRQPYFKKTTFLTQLGMCKVGTIDLKERLVADILGIDAE
eukprot:762540-Hanusia_phi.AAC.2